MRNHFQLLQFLILTAVTTALLYGVLLYPAMTGRMFVSDKVIKSLHFDARDTDRLDYVMIGSSKVLHGVSTDVFEQGGVSIYNFGAAKVYLADYYAPIRSALENKPATVVLQINPRDLRATKLTPTHFTARERLVYRQMPALPALDSLLDETLRLRFVTRWMARYWFLDHSITAADKRAIDCNIFDSRKPTDPRRQSIERIVQCDNGDAIILGQLAADSAVSARHLQYVLATEIPNGPDRRIVSDTALQRINFYIETIRRAGADPVVVLEAQDFGIPTRISSAVLSRIAAPLVDLSNFLIDQPRYWSDVGHYNAEGRLLYSRELLQRLTSL